MKRLVDIAGSAAGLLLLSPVLLAVAVAIWIVMGRPVLFRQQRPGRNGKSFCILKFRTMTDARNQRGDLLSDAERLTGVGRWLRRMSLDELPELFNVLRGEMSLVGPRPLLVEYLERYTPAQARRHEVKPGITGWAQVNGRNGIGWEEKFALDVWYVDHQSLLLDAKILALTVGTVLRGNDIAAASHATMPEFVGSGAATERGQG